MGLRDVFGLSFYLGRCNNCFSCRIRWILLEIESLYSFPVLQTWVWTQINSGVTGAAPQQISANYQQNQQPAAAATVENCTSSVGTKDSQELKACLLQFLCLIVDSLIRPRQRTLILLPALPDSLPLAFKSVCWGHGLSACDVLPSAWMLPASPVHSMLVAFQCLLLYMYCLDTKNTVLWLFDFVEAFCTSSRLFSHSMQTEAGGAQVLAGIPPLGSQDGNETVGGGLAAPD